MGCDKACGGVPGELPAPDAAALHNRQVLEQNFKNDVKTKSGFLNY